MLERDGEREKLDSAEHYFVPVNFQNPKNDPVA
jgi:hypothetical protein